MKKMIIALLMVLAGTIAHVSAYKLPSLSEYASGVKQGFQDKTLPGKIGGTLGLW